MKKRVADIVVDILVENGLKQSFSVVGGGAMHLNNAFVLAKDRIPTMYNHHEQACAMAAESYARLTGNIAVVCVTSGPGGTNAINGVQGAWVDSIPMLIISGHPRYATTVAATEGLAIRSRGVQENDIIAQVRSITKYAKLVTAKEEIRYELEKAIYLALEGRRGPVWIDIPLDVQGALVEEESLQKFEPERRVETCTDTEIEKVQNMLRSAERPCILTGSGIRSGNAHQWYKKFLEQMDIPIVGGALQADINYAGEKNYYGMSGSAGPRTGNFILQSADVILVLGNSLAFKQTGFAQENFAPQAKIIMIDACEDEGRKPGLKIELLIKADIKVFFKKWLEHPFSMQVSAAWKEHCDYVKGYFPQYEMLVRQGTINQEERVPALYFWKLFLEKAEKNAVIALGNSSSISGVLQEGVRYEEQRVLVNYNCGSMGDDLPEAIGAAVAEKRPVYCVTGDGSIMMNLQEFQTIRHYKLPVKVVLFNNAGYGAIRSTCSTFFHGTYTGCDEDSGISFPDFGKIAEAFALSYKKCSCIREMEEALKWLMEQEGACILEVMERIEEIKGPKLESKMNENGEFYTPPLHDMSPFLAEDEIQKLLKTTV